MGWACDGGRTGPQNAGIGCDCRLRHQPHLADSDSNPIEDTDILMPMVHDTNNHNGECPHIGRRLDGRNARDDGASLQLTGYPRCPGHNNSAHRGENIPLFLKSNL